MRYNIAIVDDEQEQIEYLSAIVSKWGNNNSHTCDISAFASAEAFLFENSESDIFDILLFDFEMKSISGIDLAKQLRKNGSRAGIIFITSHFEFFGEGYEVDALHYLIKPVQSDKLFTVLTKATEKLAVVPNSVIVSVNGETVKIFESDILYVESFLHYIVIHTKKQEYKIKESISDFADKLSEIFYRTHRSYLVSLKNIVRIARNAVTLEGGIEISLARGKYDDNQALIYGQMQSILDCLQKTRKPQIAPKQNNSLFNIFLLGKTNAPKAKQYQYA
jgi:DNA-binding LytR/AlgR family response regulator